MCLVGASWVAACGGSLHPFESGSASASGTQGGSGDSGDPSGASGDGGDAVPSGLLYVRCPRTQVPLEVTADVTVAGAVVSRTRTFGFVDVYDALPSALRDRDFAVPCDLMLRDDDGADTVLFDCSATSTEAQTCAAIDPAVAFDGRSIAFAVVHGSIAHRSESVVGPALDPAADDVIVRYVDLPNPVLVPTHVDIHVVDLVSGEERIAAAPPGEIRRAPTFLDDGRVMFTVRRDDRLGSLLRQGSGQAITTPTLVELFVLDDDGEGLVRAGANATTASVAPRQLIDGRVALVSSHSEGLRAYRYNNGAPGSAGAYRNIHHLYVQDPDGARFAALLGEHTHLSSGPLQHSQIAGFDQLPDGRLLFVESSSPVGAGALFAFTPDPNGLEGPAPHTVADSEVFLPTDLDHVAPWSSSWIGFSPAMPEPPLSVPGFADPLAFAGFLRDPTAIAGGALLLTWTKGACSENASNIGPPFPDEAPPPATSGTTGLTPVNALEWLGADNPGCDAGIYRADGLPLDHPNQLVPIIDSPAYHEIMPRRIGPWAGLYATAAPEHIEPAHRRAPQLAALAFATPFAVLSGSSLLQHETRSVVGNPFGSETHWALQGAQTSEWGDDEVCGVRISALATNVADDLTTMFTAMGHRAWIVAELPVRKFDGGVAVVDPLGDPDTSFRVRVPADTPLLIAGLDCEGRALSSSQVPFSTRPGEERTCGGCHVRSQLPLRFEETAAADAAPLLAGGGQVQLLAGGTPEAPELELREGFGVSIEFERDVWPILQARCVECHATDAAAGGLRLDLPGVDVGSTWWRLTADYPQQYVPVGQQSPAGTLRKPQLSRHVRFMSARGSLLYWKAANARVDGRTDADLVGDDADVDFGVDHPSAITPEELRTLARWIDTGTAGGEAVRADTAAPVLVARIAGAAPQTLALGMVDVGTGIDVDALTVQWRGDGGWTDLAPGVGAAAGIVTVALTGVPMDATLRVGVRDLAGNATTIERARASLLEP